VWRALDGHNQQYIQPTANLEQTGGASWWQMVHSLGSLARDWAYPDQMGAPANSSSKQQQQQLQQQDAADKQLAAGLLPLSAGGLSPVDRDTVPVMAVFLSKPSTHTHLVQWPLASNTTSGTTRASSSSTSSNSDPAPKQALSAASYGTLCSKHSRHESYVLFMNNTPYTVRLMWVNYRGDEVAYDTLLPGHSCIQQTFATHPWIAREVTTATQLPINMQEAFCPHKMQRPQAAVAGAVPAAAAPAAAPAGPQEAAAAEAQPGAQQPQQLQAGAPGGQQQQQQVFSFQSPNGIRRVPFSSLQRAEITVLPGLPWSESAHTHFPPAFKTAVRTFLMCHLQLQHSMQAGTAPTASAAAPEAAGTESRVMDDLPSPGSAWRSHLGCIPSVLLPHIARLAAPFAPQHMLLPLKLRPDILPTCLAEDPDAPPAAVDDADEDWFAAGEQQQQQQDEGGGVVAAVAEAVAEAEAQGAAAAVAAGEAEGGHDGYMPLVEDEGVLSEELNEGGHFDAMEDVQGNGV
jgi:hypothetical protein